MCGLEYKFDDHGSCPRCNPQIGPRFHTTITEDRHVHLDIERISDQQFEEFQAALKDTIQEFGGEVVVRD
jgi:uncharacterized HAD superfamily protein